MRFISFLLFCFLLIFCFLTIPKQAFASLVVTAATQQQLSSDQSTYSICTTDSCTLPFNVCWNSQTVGQSSCGQGCTYNGQVWGNTWTRYTYDPGTYGTQCFQTSFLGCQMDFVEVGNACSTADKYNGSPAFSGGDTTELRAGFCDCSVGGIYKTCCNAGSPAQTYVAGGNPIQPDGGCSYTSAFCGGAGQPACGQAACATATPTPTPTPAGCPGYSPAKNSPATAPGPCTTGTTCQAPCTDTCVDNQGQTCSSTSCVSVWACQGSQWYNDGTYYSTCPNNCSGNCTPNTTSTTCSITLSCNR